MTPRDAKTLELAEAWALDARSHNQEEQQSRAALIAHLEDPACVSVQKDAERWRAVRLADAQVHQEKP